jgi:hypothetical protein
MQAQGTGRAKQGDAQPTSTASARSRANRLPNFISSNLRLQAEWRKMRPIFASTTAHGDGIWYRRLLVPFQLFESNRACLKLEASCLSCCFWS